MNSFGKAKGGGRRTARRQSVPMSAVVSTVKASKPAVLVDLSSTGAKLHGYELPQRGESMWLKIDHLRCFGTVAWTEGEECGVHFDRPLQPGEVERLRVNIRAATITARGVEQHLAFEDWQSGFAR